MGSFYTYVLFVHILAGVVLLGSGLLVDPSFQRGIRRATTLVELRTWLTAVRPLEKVMGGTATVLLASGIYLTWRQDGWGAGWIQVAIALWILNSVLSARFVGPRLSRLGGAVFSASGHTITPDVDRARRSGSFPVVTKVMLSGDIGVLFLMVSRPRGLLASVVVVLASAVVVLGSSRIRARSMRSRARAGGLAEGPVAPEVGQA